MPPNITIAIIGDIITSITGMIGITGVTSATT
jgi:hypothetical protein